MTTRERSSRPSHSLYLGLISGTSLDGVDVVVLDIKPEHAETVATLTVEYPERLRSRLVDAIAPDYRLTLHEIASLDVEVAQHFANSANEMLIARNVPKREIVAIGSHGQTLRHHPFPPTPYSLQIGHPATIAARTGLVTVADFRSIDVAYGGEGAPLVPPFHAWCFGNRDEECGVLNLGGIANITLLSPRTSQARLGYDTGPGNCLLDEWCALHTGAAFDRNGAWAASGTSIGPLLNALLQDEYLRKPAPKSTGREYFNLEFVRKHLRALDLQGAAPQDVQATLAAFTVESIAIEIEANALDAASPVFVCGGGAHNVDLIGRLQGRLPLRKVDSTEGLGIHPDFVEASAFAWLAQRRLAELPVCLTTGGPAFDRLLGVVYDPRAH